MRDKMYRVHIHCRGLEGVGDGDEFILTTRFMAEDDADAEAIFAALLETVPGAVNGNIEALAEGEASGSEFADAHLRWITALGDEQTPK